MHTTKARASLKATRTALVRSRAEAERLAAHVGQLRSELAAARIDPLTGLPTRTAWSSQAEQVITRPAEAGQHFVLMLDLNGFKAVNDLYGHAAGDELLKAQAARLALWARARGVAGRLGGDEMVAAVTLNARDMRDFELEHLGTILSKPMLWGGHRITAPASIGVAIAEGHPLNVLLSAADRAMYRAKAARNLGWWRYAEAGEYVAPEAAPVHRARHRDVRTPTATR